MAQFPAGPQHAGDLCVDCPACGATFAVPVMCEFVPAGRVVSLRCTPDLSALADHATGAHGVGPVTSGHTVGTEQTSTPAARKAHP